MAAVYRSKIDLWLYLVLVAAMMASLYSALAVLRAGPLEGGTLLAILIGVGVGFVLPAWILLATFYTLDSGQLRIRSGPFRWSVPVAGITQVESTRNPLASPALSLDRLRIDYGRGQRIMISPLDREGFLRDLEAERYGTS